MSGPLVYKFGGTSVADAERIQGAVSLIAAAPRAPLVVVSALAGVTNELLAFWNAGSGDVAAAGRTAAALRARHLQVLHGLTDDPEERRGVGEALDEVLDRIERAASGVDEHAEAADSVAAIGEDLSARLVACALRAAGLDAAVVDARGVIRTDATFGRARPLESEIRGLAGPALTALLERGWIPVLQGFVGASEDGRTTTLGRGGSDLSAVLLGSALDAEVVQIWTDVDGILSGDPRGVDHPVLLTEMGFEEAVELAHFGAKVIHPGAAKHAVSNRVPLWIRNSFRPEGPGTRILSQRRGGAAIAAIAHKSGAALIKVRSHPTALQYGFLARVFEVLGRHEVAVDLVATSHSSTAFTIDEHDFLDGVREDLAPFSDVDIVRGLTTITVVGHGLLEEPGIEALAFQAVAKTPVHLISQASDVSLSFLVADEDAAGLVRRLHRALIENRNAEEAAQ